MRLTLREQVRNLLHLLVGHPQEATVADDEANGYLYCLGCGSWLTRGHLLPDLLRRRGKDLAM